MSASDLRTGIKGLWRDWQYREKNADYETREEIGLALDELKLTTNVDVFMRVSPRHRVSVFEQTLNDMVLDVVYNDGDEEHPSIENLLEFLHILEDSGISVMEPLEDIGASTLALSRKFFGESSMMQRDEDEAKHVLDRIETEFEGFGRLTKAARGALPLSTAAAEALLRAHGGDVQAAAAAALLTAG